MNKLSPQLLCQIYLLLVLLAATIMSALPYSLLALVLFLVILFITLRPIPARLNIVITVAMVFLVPLVLAPFLRYLIPFPQTAIHIMAAISVLPTIYLLDYNLRQNAHHVRAPISGKTMGRYTTKTSRTLFVTTLVMLLVSFSLSSPLLLFTSILFALYLLFILIKVLFALPRLPLDVPAVEKRVIAGTTANLYLYITSKASIRLHGVLSPVAPWVKVTPRTFTLNKDKKELNLTITPPLAGPLNPQLQVSVTDPWCFIQVNQFIEPVELHVIPRAKYAQWLAMRYLEQTGGGAGATVGATLVLPAIQIPKRGIEYFDSRNYQPGDQLKNIDWKHTLKLGRSIIKEYIESGKQLAIIAVNLSVSDAEEADKLAFNLITAALTLAQENIPTALAAYNHQQVIFTTTVTEPREILKHTLALVKDITSVELAHRFLQVPDLGKLRRNIAQLKPTKSEPAQQLLSILNFEYQAIEKAAKNHPATIALSLTTEHVPAPAVILLISQLNHDAEALLITTEKLSRRNFASIRVD